MTVVITKSNIRFTSKTSQAQKDSWYVHITKSLEVHDKKVLVLIEIM